MEENLRRVRLLFAEVQAGVQELALPNVDFDNLQHHLDNIAQENAAQVSDCFCFVLFFVSCWCENGMCLFAHYFLKIEIQMAFIFAGLDRHFIFAYYFSLFNDIHVLPT